MIDIEAYLGRTRILYPWGKETMWVGLPSHRIDPLVRSCCFSPPTKILQMDGGGSIGRQTSRVENWGRFVGNVDNVYSARNFYRKLYDVADEPDFSIRELRSAFRLHGVKNPVVHYIYSARDGIHMLWRYTHFHRHRVAGLEMVQELAQGEFENFYTFDIYAASQIRLEDEDQEVAVMLGHDEEFLYDYVRPVLMKSCGEPSPHRRIEFPEAPRVITEAIPIAQWIRR